MLGPTLFLIFINDIDRAVDVTSSVLLKFADDTKVARVVETEDQKEEMQATINRLVKWSADWQMLFNSGKCHLLHLGRGNARYEYNMEGRALQSVEYEKDVGVTVHQSMKPSMQCARAAGRANAILGQLARAVRYRSRETFLTLYKVYVRPHLEYAGVSWSPWLQQDRDALERVQRRAIGMVSNLGRGTYEEKLEEVGMLSLGDRRERGDMIATYKILSGKDKVDPGLIFSMGGVGPGPQTRQTTAIHHIRKQTAKPKTDIRRYSFSQRVVTTWNALPDRLKGVDTVLAFKVGFDKWVKDGRPGAR